MHGRMAVASKGWCWHWQAWECWVGPAESRAGGHGIGSCACGSAVETRVCLERVRFKTDRWDRWRATLRCQGRKSRRRSSHAQQHDVFLPVVSLPRPPLLLVPSEARRESLSSSEAPLQEPALLNSCHQQEHANPLWSVHAWLPASCPRGHPDLDTALSPSHDLARCLASTSLSSPRRFLCCTRG